MSKKISYEEQQKNMTIAEFARSSLVADKVWVIRWDDHSAVPTEDSGDCDYCARRISGDRHS